MVVIDFRQQWLGKGISLVVSIIFGLLMYEISFAQTAPFLVSPYYEQEIVTQGYNSSHNAYDYGLNYEVILAGAGGTVDRVTWWNNNCHHSHTSPQDTYNCGFGLYVRIDHNNNYRSYYAHLSSAAFRISTTNGAASTGEVIGTSGATGWTIGSTPGTPGPHLHLQVQRYVNNVWNNIDPASPNLWKDGQWSNPSRPIPAPTNGGETVVNETTNNSGGFSKGSNGPFNGVCTGDCGNWTYTSSMYWTYVNGAVQDSWSRWQPSLSFGVYEVMVYIPNVSNTTTWQAPYTIVHVDGTSHAVVDQLGSRGRWISIGTYRMNSSSYVYLTDASGEGLSVHCGSGQYCRLGADAVKFVQRGTTYAPDMRDNNGWTSTMTVRNNGSGPAQLTIRYLRTNGSNACSGILSTLPAHGSATYSCPMSVIASTVVNANQDVSVAVLHEHGSPYTIDGYAGVENPESTVYVPILQKNNSGWYSDLFIQNASKQIVSVSVNFIPGLAGNSHTAPYTLAPYGTAQISLSGISQIGATFIGSAKVTSSQPLAVASTQFNGTAQLMATSNSQGLATTLHAPIIQNNNPPPNGYLSGLTLLNASGSTQSLDVN